MKIIARIHCDFKEKFGIPRQSGLVPQTRAKIIFEPEYRSADALRGIETYSHLWLIFLFKFASIKSSRKIFFKSFSVTPIFLSGLYIIIIFMISMLNILEHQ